MSPSSHYDQIAGLDAMVLHLNTPTSSSSALDGVPSISVSRQAQRRNSKRSNLPLVPRSPLQNKSHEFNIKSHIPSHKYSSSSRSNYPFHQDSSHSTQRSRNASFHPLPPLPSASSLELTSFFDITFNPVTPYSPPPGRFTPQLRLSTQIHEQFESVTERREESYRIPTLQHPNSPYVPWTSPIRRQFLRPLTPSSVASSLSHFPRRTGTMVSELQEPPSPEAENPIQKNKKGWRRLNRIKQNVGRVAKRLVQFTIPSKSAKAKSNPQSLRQTASPLPKVHLPTPSNDTQRRRLSRSRQFASSPVLRSPSRTSMLSTDTNSLAVWLAARQRENLAEMEEPLVLMTLEEYELMGSWLDVASKAKEKEREWTCGMKDCDIQNQKDTQPGVTEANELSSSSSGKEVTAQSPKAQEKARAFDSSRERRTNHRSSRFCSLPRLPPSKWLDSVEDTTTPALKASPISRSLNMSGDWSPFWALA